MKEQLIEMLVDEMREELSPKQLAKMKVSLGHCLGFYTLERRKVRETTIEKNSFTYMKMFLAAKRIEGCSEQTVHYYESILTQLLKRISKNIQDIGTEDLRCYLSEYQDTKNIGKVTLDNVRRIFSSFFSWLEDEDYILKSPVRRIHKVKEDKVIKETFSDENIEKLRDGCDNTRDLAIVELLNSTGMRVGELVRLNRCDIDFHKRECIVFGKGNKQRMAYFDAKTKIHLLEYLNSRTDSNVALFVSRRAPYERLKIGGVQCCLRRLGGMTGIDKVHPHKFRRTMATVAIDKGMPIEQLQNLLGHTKIDTTMHYAMVNQDNVKISHRKFIG